MSKRKSVSTRTRFEVFKRDRFTCQYCGGKPPEVVLHLDHIIPVALDGTNELSNLVTSCADCNLGKSDVPLDDVRPGPSKRDILDMREARDQLEAYQEFLMEDRARREAYAEQIAQAIESRIRYRPKPKDLASIRGFLQKLPAAEVLDAVDAVAIKDKIGWDGWRYFCGVCWTKIRNNTPIERPQTQSRSQRDVN